MKEFYSKIMEETPKNEAEVILRRVTRANLDQVRNIQMKVSWGAWQ